MIEYSFFLFSGVVGLVIGGIFGFTLFQTCGRVTAFTIIATLICAAGCACFLLVVVDGINSDQTISCKATNFTIIDTFQQHTIFGEDLTAKLSNGYLVHYTDPYIWKKAKPGDPYPVISYNYVSFIYGNVSGYSYYNGCTRA